MRHSFETALRRPDTWPMLNGFSRFPLRPDPHLKLYKVSRTYSAQGGRNAAVVPVSLIKRSVHLFPKWGRDETRSDSWASETVLEKCEDFYLTHSKIGIPTTTYINFQCTPLLCLCPKFCVVYPTM